MLSADDAALVQRDPGLTALRTLLDPEAFLEAARAACPDQSIQDVAIKYVRYKPGVNCLVSYDLVTDAEILQAYAKAYPEDTGAKLQKKAPGTQKLRDLPVLLFNFPYDGKLKSLSRLHDGHFLPQYLRSPDRGVSFHILRYKPERRCVARIDFQGTPGAAVKAYTRQGFAAAFRAANVLVDLGPKLIGHSDRFHMLIFEWLRGRTFLECMAAGTWSGQCAGAIAESMASIHRMQAKGLAIHEPAAGLPSLTEDLCFLMPGLGGRIRETADRIRRAIVEDSGNRSPVHGDFHPGQVIFTDPRISVLDLDRAGICSPMVDIGTFVAHVEREAIYGNLTANQVGEIHEELIRSYELASGSRAAEQPYTALALFRLLPEPFRHRKQDWLHVTERLLGRIEEMLRQATTETAAVMQELKPAFLRDALDSRIVDRQFRHEVCGLQDRVLSGIQIIRHKPGKRCLIEYNWARKENSSDVLTLLGKAKAARTDLQTHHLQRQLWNGSFGPYALDGVHVPEPVGILPQFHMWLQKKIEGRTAGSLLAAPTAPLLMKRVAAAIYKLHTSELRTERRHTIADELQILRDRLSRTAAEHPASSARLQRIYEGCEELAGLCPPPEPCGIHRDFYHDQVLFSGSAVYLLDLDLYSEGDSALDIGNFVGHLKELSLRTWSDPDALSGCEEALQECYLGLCGRDIRRSFEVYTTLTLARHIFLSTQFADRKPFTRELMEICEERLEISNTLSLG